MGAGEQGVTGYTEQKILNISFDPSVGLLKFAPMFWDGGGYSQLSTLFAAITASTSGNTSVVSAVASKKIRVLALFLMANGTVNVKWQSNTTDKTGLIYLIANTGLVLPFSQGGWFETASGEALNINLSGNVAVGGGLVYITV